MPSQHEEGIQWAAAPHEYESTDKTPKNAVRCEASEVRREYIEDCHPDFVVTSRRETPTPNRFLGQDVSKDACVEFYLPDQELDWQLSESLQASRGPSTERKLPGHKRLLGLGTGWRAGVKAGLAVTLTIMFVTTAMTVWAILHFPLDDAIGVVYHGNCEQAGYWSLGLHIVINTLSSLVLAASNYCMQCVYAPTRTQVDAAHCRGKWLEIGTLGFRNLSGGMGWKRMTILLVLVTSSLPMHLIYNSAIFKAGILDNFNIVSDDICELHFSIINLTAVVVLDFIKAMAMLATLYAQDDPLITVGDSIASFLSRPDRCTRGKCLTSKRSAWLLNGSMRPTIFSAIRIRRRKWASAPGLWHFGFFLIMNLCFSMTFVALIIISKSERFRYNPDYASYLSRASGLSGLLSPNAMFSLLYGNSWGVIFSGSLANLPQLGLSVLNLSCNSIATRMALADEYSAYGIRRRGLRVSSPRGAQRSTYWLQLPYRYSIPLIGIWTFLHWTVSQSFFMLRTVNGMSDLNSSYAYFSTAAFSLVPAIIFLCADFLLVVAVLLFACKRFKSPMPVAGFCSAAISAACHAPTDDTNAAMEHVKWGVVPGCLEGTGFAHCSFSSKEVTEPEEGVVYA